MPDTNAAMLEIFRAGTHTAMDGSSTAFSESDIQASASAYDPAKHEAPIVIGHPKLDAPAYGWISRLSCAGNSLEAEPRQVAPEFADMVRDGRFKKISSAFYAPSHPRNPVPGVYYLKHVGFLGAMPPAVKGMRDPAFSADDEGDQIVTFEFGESDQITADFFRNFREWMIAKFSPEEADKVIPNYLVDALQAEAQRERMEQAIDSATAGESGFSETSPGDNQMTNQPDDLLKREADLAAREAAFAEREAAAIKAAEDAAAFAEQKRVLDEKEADIAAREAALTAAEAERRAREIEEFAETLTKEGRLLLRDKSGAVAFLSALDASASIEFADGDETKTESPADWFRGFLSRLPIQVQFGEFGAPEIKPNVVTFAAPPGYEVDRDRLDIDAKAKAYQSQNPGTAYADAVIAVGG